MAIPSPANDPGGSRRRRLPSLNALKAFEAAARQQSFTRAAQELCVTQGAVSQQVKALEDELGVRLFRRDGQRLSLTEAGDAYLAVVRDAFDRLRAGTEQLLQREISGVLAVTTSPNFAAKWLVPRLGRFAQAHPDIVLTLHASADHIDFARSQFDLAIRHGNGHWPGLNVKRLCGEQLFPVCSPRLLEGKRALRQPIDLSRYTLLHVNGRDEWAQWLSAAAADGVDCSRGPLLNQASMAIDAAIEGQGIALARTALASWDLLAGRLVRPFRESLDAPYAFWIVYPNSKAELPKICAFESWLLSEAREDSRRLAALERTARELRANSRPHSTHPRR